MPIVPIYRLHATPAGRYERYRFSRDAHPSPNPNPGKPDPDPSTRWTVDRVAFYAWSDTVQLYGVDDRLLPVYEFHQVGEDKTVRYLYSVDPAPPDGWTSHDYVAFWMYPEKIGGAGARVYLYSQPISGGVNYGLSVSPELDEPWKREAVLGSAAATVSVEVSVRQQGRDSRYHWTYTPSTINVAYPCSLHFGQAPRSNWRFTGLEIVGDEGNFDKPVVTDTTVLVNARYAQPGQTFKYRLTVDVMKGPDRLVGDPEVVNLTPDRL